LAPFYLLYCAFVQTLEEGQEDDLLYEVPCVVSTFSVTISKGIEVVATRKGFYNQRRISEGEKFIVKKKENLGEWMKCVDPALERERFNFFKNKKAKK
jgi:hypothetical protein